MPKDTLIRDFDVTIFHGNSVDGFIVKAKSHNEANKKVRAFVKEHDFEFDGPVKYSTTLASFDPNGVLCCS